jgi:alpha-glucosidase (family GH31 glycosyl hydrolase)
MRAWVALLLCACNQLPDQWTLKGPGITVEVSRAPYGYSVRDATGKLVVSTAGAGASDGYGSIGWTTGRVDWMPIATFGYQQFDAVFDKWRDAAEVTAATQKSDRLEVTLSDGTRVVHQLRASTLRVEASRGDKPRAWEAAFRSPSDEDFLGLGERYNKVNQRGHSLYSWQEEGGLSKGEKEKASPTNPYPNGEGMTYYPVPFLISTAGYGFWLDSTWRNQFDLATDKPDRWRAWHIGPTLNYEIYVPLDGDARPWPLTLIDLFTATTGRPMVPVAWSFGPRRRINRSTLVGGVLEAQAMRDQGLAISAADDANHYLPRGGRLDAGGLAYNDTLKSLGYKPVCYFNPYISTDPAAAIAPQAQVGLDQHYYLQLPDGSPSMVWLISGGSVTVYTVDVSNPEAASWFTGMFDAALQDGYRGWMYDFGEYVQPEVVAKNGMTGEEFHNLFPVLYDKVAHDALAAGAYKDDWYYFSRSGYTGSQQYAPMVWSGDPDASFSDAEGLPAQVRAGINMGVSGVAHWGSDIGGYKCLTDGGTAADGELLTRWIEAGSMQSNMHDEDACAGNNDGVPKATIWTSDDARQAWKTYAKLHTRMFPYLWALAQEAQRTGAPLIQHLFLQHPEPRFAGVDDAHYFGPSLLVAPVVARGARQKQVTLPDGDWLEWQPDGTAQLVRGQVTLDAPLGKLPLLLRDGHLLPLLDPSIETLVEDDHPGIIGPKEVAQVYDVVGFVTRATGKADFTLGDGTQLKVTWAGGLDTGSLRPAASAAELATCESCWLEQDLAGVKRVLISSASGVTAGGLTLESQVGRRVRWDLYLVE